MRNKEHRIHKAKEATALLSEGQTECGQGVGLANKIDSWENVTCKMCLRFRFKKKRGPKV